MQISTSLPYSCMPPSLTLPQHTSSCLRGKLAVAAWRAKALFLRRQPVVHLYALLRQERLLPYFLWHYDYWVDRIFLYDDRSCATKPSAAHNHPKVVLRPLSDLADSAQSARQAFWRDAWKESRGQADWACVVEVDEFLHHPHGRDFLRTSQKAGITVLPTVGYEVITRSADPLAAQAGLAGWHEVGSTSVGKIGAFNPDTMRELAPVAGWTAPRGSLGDPRSSGLRLLRYRMLPAAYSAERYRLWRPRD